METIRKEIKTDDPINLYIFGDEHIGDRHADIENTIERIEKCKNDPNGVAVCIGDICNIATKDSVSFGSYGDKISPLDQMKYAAEIFRPIKDKILVWLDGNHENRINKLTSFQPGQIIANELGVPYAENSALIFLRFGKTNKARPIAYTISVTHGSGGGGKVGGKANRLEQRSQVVDADCYIIGHVHQSLVFCEDYFRTSWQNSSVEKITRTFICIGSALDYGGYGEAFSFVPGSKRYPVAHLNPNIKEITVTI